MLKVYEDPAAPTVYTQSLNCNYSYWHLLARVYHTYIYIHSLSIATFTYMHIILCLCVGFTVSVFAYFFHTLLYTQHRRDMRCRVVGWVVDGCDGNDDGRTDGIYAQSAYFVRAIIPYTHRSLPYWVQPFFFFFF